MVSTRVLSVKRNSGSQQNFEGSLSQQKTRRMMVCVKVAQIKKKELCTNTTVKTTGIKTVPLISDDLVSASLTNTTIVTRGVKTAPHLR